MNGVELFKGLIARYERRIKNANTNPDPKKLRSNILLYENELDYFRSVLNAQQTGKPIGASLAGQGLIKALGMEYLEMVVTGQRNPKVAQCFETVQREGIPGDGCDMCSAALAACFDEAMPVPSYVITPQSGCTPLFGTFTGARNYYNIPGYTLHIPPGRNEENLAYVVEQLEEIIEDVESRIPSTKYNEDTLRTLQQKNHTFWKIYRETFEFLKVSPCPQAGKDAFRGLRWPNRYPNQDKVLDYMRARRDELGERVAKGIGVVTEEKLRILWAVTGPFLYWNPFEFLEARGVTVPFLLIGGSAYPGLFPTPEENGSTRYFGRKLTPLEDEIIGQMHDPWAGGGFAWSKTVTACCKDLRCDGVVHFMQRGATCVSAVGRIVKDSLETNEGIPVLLMEGRQMNATEQDAKRQATELEEFIEICLEAKKRRASQPSLSP